MTCGVYAIRNVSNDHAYIGSSVNIEKRWREHKGALRRGTHHCRYLQNAWNKYGSQWFVFEVLKVCEETELRAMEDFMLEFYKPKYNDNPNHHGRMGTRHRKESKLKMSEAKAGVKHPGARLTENDIDTIRRLYFHKEYTQVELGKLYGVTSSHISGICRGIYWKKLLMSF